MNIKIDRWYVGLPFDEIKSNGYVPVGRPALIAMIPTHLTNSILEQVVLDVNSDKPNLEVNAYALYGRIIEQRDYTIAQPLKRISRKK